MPIFKLALRNLLGAGLRVWLNAFVLSLSYVLIIWHQGIIDGWDMQAKRDMIAWEVGGGQFWHPDYDPYDPFTLESCHSPIPEELQQVVDSGAVVPIVISQGTLYPAGRMQSVILKGIPPEQTVLELPTSVLKGGGFLASALIGKRMAKSCELDKGDIVLVRWRDSNGTFDATEIVIADVFDTNVPAVDMGVVWLSLEGLQGMLQLPGEATMLVVSSEYRELSDMGGWSYKSVDELTVDLTRVIKSKSIGGSVLYVVLMALAMLAVFDTQVLSVFRRQKEIGLFMALGMTRRGVVWLFTLEGAMNSLFALFMAAVYGLPLFYYTSAKGYSMPAGSDEYGLAIAEIIYPEYGLGLVLGTIAFIVIATTVVSYLPSGKISNMNPTDAIRGRLQ